MNIWLNRQENLCRGYSIVGFLLSASPVIMKDAAEKKTEEQYKAINRLIYKLFLVTNLVVQERVEARADIVDTFWKEYSDFTLRT